jgi:hypothetical protein
MLETQVIGNKDWAMEFLTAADVRLLEDFDCEMRIRFVQQKQGRSKAKTYKRLVEEPGDKCRLSASMEFRSPANAEPVAPFLDREENGVEFADIVRPRRWWWKD